MKNKHRTRHLEVGYPGQRKKTRSAGSIIATSTEAKEIVKSGRSIAAKRQHGYKKTTEAKIEIMLGLIKRSHDAGCEPDTGRGEPRQSSYGNKGEVCGRGNAGSTIENGRSGSDSEYTSRNH